jgi:hypothetical protein
MAPESAVPLALDFLGSTPIEALLPTQLSTPSPPSNPAIIQVCAPPLTFCIWHLAFGIWHLAFFTSHFSFTIAPPPRIHPFTLLRRGMRACQGADKA